MPGKRHVLIPAGGLGSRMGTDMPKQFLSLAGKPILIRTIEIFLQTVEDLYITIVLPMEYFSAWEKMKQEFLPDKKIVFSKGGLTRFDSVKNGLAILPDEGVVAIHDAVRPFASKALIENCFLEAEKHGSAIPAVEPKDSVFEIAEEKVFSRNRIKYRLAQTPQCFSLNEIKKAFNQPYQSSFTDDASVYESDGGNIHLVNGEYTNFKITTKEDLQFADTLLGEIK